MMQCDYCKFSSTDIEEEPCKSCMYTEVDNFELIENVGEIYSTEEVL